jgi:hypothetical protein
MGFHPGPRPSLARPRPPPPTSPAPGHAPLAPHTPLCAPPPSLSHFVSRAATSSPSLCHLFALGDPVDGYRWILDPKVSPHLPLSSPFLFFLLSSPRTLSLGRAPSWSRPTRRTRSLASPSPARSPPALPSQARSPPAAPSPGRVPLGVCPRPRASGHASSSAALVPGRAPLAPA